MIKSNPYKSFIVLDKLSTRSGFLVKSKSYNQLDSWVLETTPLGSDLLGLRNSSLKAG